MPIESLTVTNFKGIADQETFEIRPITLLIGPNSSGKSSCIHALAAMAQTVKLPSSNRHIVLDDEYAQVHLGRFIEVIHSKSYSDSIEIGLSLGKLLRVSKFGKIEELIKIGDPVNVSFSFKSTKRTQDVFLERAEFVVGSVKLLFKIDAKKLAYSVRMNNKPVLGSATLGAGLRLSIRPSARVKGLDYETYTALVAAEMVNDLLNEELRKTLYLGPFRQSPLRRYPTRGSSPAEVGAAGESAITLLANEHVQSKSRAHMKQISAWLNTIKLAKGIEVSRVGKSDLFGVDATLEDGDTLPIADLGYGVSQVLPVLAQCSFAPKGATLLFEQPELHLHPAAAQRLASVLVNAAMTKNLRIVAETHSKELFFQLFEELKAGNLAMTDIAAYEVSRKNGKSEFKRIRIEAENGHFTVYDPWQKGICHV